MSPRSSSGNTSPSARNTAAPYPRRSGSQPKSSRQQFSACGACRMRRVRCDLKDLPINAVGPHPSCSNCNERGIKCVDEFADVKAVKLLRRGRRLQQVEAIYGKVNEREGSAPLSATHSAPRVSASIPQLQLEFFASHFWRCFVLQRPILDPVEFPSRFAAHCKGTQPLGNEGVLIAMILVAWAASFGLDERGHPEADESAHQSPNEDSPDLQSAFVPQEDKSKSRGRRGWKSKCDVYVREIIELVDLYGILRRPSLDGVRALLLLLPLMEESHHLERLAVYETTLSHVQAICVSYPSSPGGFEDAAVRARIFWYAYAQEGMMTGIRNGRFVLHEEDYDAFQRSLPALSGPGMNASHLPSPSSPPLFDANSRRMSYPGENGQYTPREMMAQESFVQLASWSSLPLSMGNVCRKIHASVTGPKARRRAEEHGLIDANGMRDIWHDLDRCWREFETLKRESLEQQGNVSKALELEQYVHGWQVFIFECHNAIRDALKGYMSSSSAANSYAGSSSRPSSSHSTNSSPYMSPHHLHQLSTRKCQELLPRVISILRLHVSNERSDISGIFRWDVGLLRDGCFWAGVLAASSSAEVLEIPTEELKNEGGDALHNHITVDESVSICLTALAAMRWGFSKSEERDATVRMVWQNRKMRNGDPTSQNPQYDPEYPPSIHMPANHIHLSAPSNGLSNSLPTTPEDRPMLPPLSFFPSSQRRVESAPTTAASVDGRGLNGWPSYTPPGTATSVATSTTSAGFSGRGSPIFSNNLASFKSTSDEMFYQSSGDLDHFNYNVPLAGPIVRENSGLTGSVPGYAPRHAAAIDSNALSTAMAASATGYPATSNGSFPSPNPHMAGQADFHAACPQFGENCNGSYH